MSTSAERNWADLPLELLEDIAGRLTSHDYRRFRRVCISWASVKSPCMLYLLLSGDDGGEYQTLLRATDHTAFPVPPLPALHGKWCVGSQDDWLATLDEFSQVSLFNLITREEIKLPFLVTIPKFGVLSITKFGWQHWGRIFDPEDFRFIVSVSKVAFSPDPSPANYTAVVLLGHQAPFLYTRAGDDKWTAAEGLENVQDVIYRDGRFLALLGNGKTVAVDLSVDSRPSASVTGRLADALSSTKYLVDSAGDLLQVRRLLRRTKVGDEDRKVIKTTSIEVFRWDAISDEWVPVESLGDRSLLVGTCSSFSFSAQEIPGLKGNRVYFTDDYWTSLYGGRRRQATCGVGVFRLEDGSFEPTLPRLPTPMASMHPPIWIILSKAQSKALSGVGVDG